METFTLIVWQLIPEDLKLYLVPHSVFDHEQLAIIHAAHGETINAGESVDNALVLSYMMSDTDQPTSAGQNLPTWKEEWLGCLIPCEIPEEQIALPTAATISHIVVTGFML